MEESSSDLNSVPKTKGLRKRCGIAGGGRDCSKGQLSGREPNFCYLYDRGQCQELQQGVQSNRPLSVRISRNRSILKPWKRGVEVVFGLAALLMKGMRENLQPKASKPSDPTGAQGPIHLSQGYGWNKQKTLGAACGFHTGIFQRLVSS